MTRREERALKTSGWGRYPEIESEIVSPYRKQDVLNYVSTPLRIPLIARGLGRSYGDSSIGPLIMDTLHLDRFLHFDRQTGILSCSAGVSFADILEVLLPQGWFPSVTPGTRFVTVGGAVASDVHGKNHHVEGSFCDHVTSLKVATESAGIVECSREKNSKLFRATCGGMGLTGIILEASFKLKPVQGSSISNTIIKAGNLEEALELFTFHENSTYSVAWIDCMATGKSLGRSLLMLGEHTNEGGLSDPGRKRVSIPCDLPGFLLNRFSAEAFNSLYYHRLRKRKLHLLSSLESFFYPLDGIGNWNRIYGKRGFVQYQPVLPRESGLQAVEALLKCAASSKRGSFLAVLKVFGKGNDNLLSFPMEGYTLALDFKMGNGVFELLDELDRIVLDFGGKVYLAKDARMPEEFFKKSYPLWEDFMNVRTEYGADKMFHSMQSRRLGL